MPGLKEAAMIPVGDDDIEVKHCAKHCLAYDASFYQTCPICEAEVNGLTIKPDGTAVFVVKPDEGSHG